MRIQRYVWRTWHSNEIEHDILDCDPDITEEKLKAIEEEEGETGRINWHAWHKLIPTVRQELLNTFGTGTPKSYKGRKAVWVYDLDGNEIGKYPTVLDAEEKTGVLKGSITTSIKRKRPLWAHKKLFSYIPLTRKEALKLIVPAAKFKGGFQSNGRPAGVPKWVYNATTHDFIGQYNDTFQVAQAFQITANQVNYQAWLGKPLWRKNILIANNPLPREEVEKMCTPKRNGRPRKNNQYQ